MAMAQGKQASQTGSSSSSSSNQSSTTGAAGEQEMLQIVIEHDPKIQRVPQLLRDTESSKDSYDPMVISLGPFHHGNPKLERMEKLKISMKQRFVYGVGEANAYNKFLEVARNAGKEYYMLKPEEEKMDDDQFLQILFVDACFLIEFIHASTRSIDQELLTRSSEHELRKMKSLDLAFVRRDIFLLENQLPFPIIEALMMLRFKEEKPYEMIKKFVGNVIQFKPRQGSRIDRLMSFIRKTTEADSSDRKLGPHTDPQPIHLLHALQMQLVDESKVTPENGPKDDWYSYRTVSELKAAGIHLRPGGKYSRFTDMSFHSNIAHGTLTLKPMVIDDSSKALFLNLCAFEALPDTPDDLGVTSYLCFMDSLIDSAEDVKELRTTGILFNFMGSDQQVADMFNDITDRLVPKVNAYAQVKSAIENHYNSHLRTWIAQAIHTHFSTPWTVIGFVLALLATLLSLVQTYFSIYPRPSP